MNCIKGCNIRKVKDHFLECQGLGILYDHCAKTKQNKTKQNKTKHSGIIYEGIKV